MKLNAEAVETPFSKLVWKATPLRNAVSTRFLDFWLMGGASIVLWLVCCVAHPFRYDIEIINGRFTQMAAFFSILTIFCNHPHFMITYKFGYGRGLPFIRRNWLPLIVVPVAMLALYAVAYLKFDAQIAGSSAVMAFNSVMRTIGLDYRLGTLANLGTELLSLSVMFMSLTVGWHYAKQVFGCMMVYARYDGYPMSPFQRGLLKASLFSVAVFNFVFISTYAPEYNSNSIRDASFFNIPLVTIGLPPMIIPITAAICALLALAVAGGVFYANYRRHGKRPSANLLVAWVAFLVWWIPIVRQTEFYFLAVPFFHSLQYLPFAHQLEKRRSIARTAALLGIGFAAFELVPSLLDKWLETRWSVNCQFFLISFVVFINIHHFFIDSVVWKFGQKEIRDGLFGERSRPAD